MLSFVWRVVQRRIRLRWRSFVNWIVIDPTAIVKKISNQISNQYYNSCFFFVIYYFIHLFIIFSFVRFRIRRLIFMFLCKHTSHLCGHISSGLLATRRIAAIGLIVPDIQCFRDAKGILVLLLLFSHSPPPWRQIVVATTISLLHLTVVLKCCSNFGSKRGRLSIKMICQL